MKKRLFALTIVLMFLLTGTLPLFATASTPTGDLTINIAAPHTLNGRTIEVYKILDVTRGGSSPNYSYTYTPDSDFAAWYGTSHAFLDGKPLDEFLFGANATSHTFVTREIVDSLMAVAEGISPTATQTVSASPMNPREAVFINLGIGFYLVYGEFNAYGEDDNETPFYALVSVVESGSMLDILAKTDVPEVSKEAADAEELPLATAQIGDTITFTVTTQVPDTTGFTRPGDAGSYRFTITDTLSAGLTLDESSVVVKVNGSTVAEGTAYTETTSTNSLEIDFLWSEFQNYTRGHEIVITYDATLNGNAEIGNIGNLNRVIIEYSNDPRSDNPRDDTTTTPPEDVEVYTYELELHKYSGVSTNGLAGAKFILVRGEIDGINVTRAGGDGAIDGIAATSGDGELVSVYQVSPGVYRVATESDTPVEFGIMTTNASGDINIKGLDAGTYQLWEVEAPAGGYVLLEDPVTIVIAHSVNDGDLTTTATVDTTALVGDALDRLRADGVVELGVENKHGSQLPSTGGIGRALMYASGVMLMGGAGTLVAIRKKITGK